MIKRYSKTYYRTYKAYMKMIERCEDPNSESFKWYGAEGVKVHPKFRHDFEAFVAEVGIRPDGYTLDRKDCSKGYEPGNIAWADTETQQNNRRNNVNIEFNGKTQTMTQWARELRINKNTLRGRLVTGWPVEKALTQPARKKRTQCELYLST